MLVLEMNVVCHMWHVTITICIKVSLNKWGSDITNRITGAAMQFGFCFVLGLTALLNIWGNIATAVVLWPMCCHTGMPCCRHRTWHPTPSQYTATGPTCRSAIHWCGTSHWNRQLPILISWVRPDREILPRPFTHTGDHSTWCCHGGQQSEAQ